MCVARARLLVNRRIPVLPPFSSLSLCLCPFSSLSLCLRPANSLFRSPCSSSSSTSTFTTTAATTISTASSSATTTADLLPRIEPFSSSLDLLRYTPPEHKKISVKQKYSSTRHARRRYFKNADDDKGVRKLSSNPYGFTTDEEGTEDDSDDTDAFLSARSLVSSDSSGFYTSKRLPKSRSCRHNRQRQQQKRRRRRRAASCLEARSVRGEEVGFRPLVTTAEAELRKALAVVKRSRDPYGDFRESMVEMIVERQMFGAADLQRLLRTYLSLNSPRLHPVLLQAFSDIWVVLRSY